MKPSLAAGAASLLLTLGIGCANAQAPAGTLFKEKDVTESGLIDALTPEPAVRTRSIKVRPNSSASPAPQAAAPEPAKKAEASLLITFETGSAELTPRAKVALDKVGRALNSEQLAEFEFSVEGHADPRGGSEANLKLSQSRAESVVDYLANAHNVPRNRLHAVGKGAQELMNPSVPSAEENRRVTIKTVLK
jgi:outer membrane protein OmpA-like peptidoglycan-associated protein